MWSEYEGSLMPRPGSTVEFTKGAFKGKQAVLLSNQSWWYTVKFADGQVTKAHRTHVKEVAECQSPTSSD